MKLSILGVLAVLSISCDGKQSALVPFFIGPRLIDGPLRSRRGVSTHCSSAFKDILKCDLLPIPDVTSESAITRYCQDLECKLKCFKDSIGECYKEDYLFALEPRVEEVFFRAVCDNPARTSTFYRSCVTLEDTCLVPFNNGVNSVILPLYQKRLFAEYKREYCSLITDFHDCLRQPGSISCPSELATFGEDINIAGTSFQACGFTQSHPYFAKYGGEPSCDTTPRPTARPTPRPTARPTPRPTARPKPRPTVRPTARPNTYNSSWQIQITCFRVVGIAILVVIISQTGLLF